ncbi:DNA-binding transcriptional regulator, FrmR family [Melghirimyces thermohalophilus]|uniref:DNA-binding transcriptional regulator, FrmR family n=1 Tax=Melghirimyces thermohalophilus TaxID=1236220 RepID=A0A1G6KQ93_9BACL|nr:metal-sensing transcriptional repressor [Melghirimyces thermohalophilus]SDC33133.1 DNA-binding transcriptional regulator, FrmR family [Melghirimyces thermohalophilus]
MSDEMMSHKEPLVPRSDRERTALQNRLKRIEGQIRGLQNMVEEDRYCMDILVQITAIQSALKQVGFSLLERHSRTCLSHAIQSGQGEEYIEELMKVIKQFSKS